MGSRCPNISKNLCSVIQRNDPVHLSLLGCGWGTLMRHVAREFGAVSTGVTLSVEGAKWCNEQIKKEGIKNANILTMDYRDIPKENKYQAISAIEMAEHVGIANFQLFLGNIYDMLEDDGMFLMQVAGLRKGANWQDTNWGLFMSKYIFPGADASTPLNWYVKQLEQAGFEVQRVENIGRHYSHTLHKWYDNWMSHKEEVLRGEIDAESDHTKGTHLFRLYEFAWAYCAIASGISSARHCGGRLLITSSASSCFVPSGLSTVSLQPSGHRWMAITR